MDRWQNKVRIPWRFLRFHSVGEKPRLLTFPLCPYVCLLIYNNGLIFITLSVWLYSNVLFFCLPRRNTPQTLPTTFSTVNLWFILVKSPYYIPSCTSPSTLHPSVPLVSSKLLGVPRINTHFPLHLPFLSSLFRLR